MSPTPPPVVRPRRRSLLFRIVRGGFVLAALAVVFLLTVPLLLSGGYAREQLAAGLSEALGMPVRIGDHSLTWSGFTVGSLEIGSPTATGPERPHLRVREASGHFSWMGLARGRGLVTARITGIEARVNLPAGAPASRRGHPGPWRPGPDDASAVGKMLRRLRLDFELEDATLRIERAQEGRVDTVRIAQASLRKPLQATTLDIRASGEGLTLAGTLDATLQEAAHFDLRATGFDLARWLPGCAGALDGTLQGEFDFARGALRASGQVRLDDFEYAGRRLQGFVGDLSMADGNLTLRSAAGAAARLDGGPISLEGKVALDAARQMPAEVHFVWQEGQVAAAAIPVLQYFLPALAGLGGGGAVDFASKAAAEFRFAGPALPREGQTWLANLEAWEGGGELMLRDGAFTPSPALTGLLHAAGLDRRLEFRSFGGRFQLAKGQLETTLVRLDSKAKPLGFRGRTSLAGGIDYVVDVTSLLEGHRDGERVRKALGNQPLEARLTGTLQAPRLAVPDLTSMLLQSELPRLLEELLRRKKKN